MQSQAETSVDKRASKADRYILYLGSVCAKSGPRAQLRRTLRKEPVSAHSAHRYVASWLPERAHAEAEAAYYCVAALYAEFSVAGPDTEVPERSFGTWLAKSAVASDASLASVESRLHHLVRLDGVMLRSRLPYLISSASRGGGTSTLPWAKLLNDLTWWESNSSIAKRWLQDYYRVAATPAKQQDSASAEADDPTPPEN